MGTNLLRGTVKPIFKCVENYCYYWKCNQGLLRQKRWRIPGLDCGNSCDIAVFTLTFITVNCIKTEQWAEEAHFLHIWIRNNNIHEKNPYLSIFKCYFSDKRNTFILNPIVSQVKICHRSQIHHIWSRTLL
jgi:hypothetical protein